MYVSGFGLATTPRKMKLAIMQPYFLPYIGYFQLIAAVDTFVVYDNIKYRKSGWINRNRLLHNGSDAMFSLPLKKGSDSLNVIARDLAPDFNRAKLLAQFAGAYRRAPHFAPTFRLLERIIQKEGNNLFHYIHHSIVTVCQHLGIETDIRVSSTLHFDNELKGQDKVVAICEAVGADYYINSIGGIELYARPTFAAHGIELQFLKPRPFEYLQLGAQFVPWLSIVDVLMFNPIEAIHDCLERNYDLV